MKLPRLLLLAATAYALVSGAMFIADSLTAPALT